MAAVALLGAAVCAAAPVFPALSGRVVDQAGILPPAARAELEEMLAAHERAGSNQVVVVTVDSLQGYAIEDFGYQLGRHWGIGQEGRDNGIVLLIAPQEREVRIEVGYGLEGAIPDAYARRIIADTISPHFREGDFFGGLQAGVGAIGKLIDGEPLPEPKTGAQAEGGEPGWLEGLFVILVGGMIATVVLGRVLGSLAGGAGAGLLALMKGLSLPLAGAVGVFAFLFFLAFAASGGGGMRPGGRPGSRGGPVIWTGGDRWGGGGGGGGGGFSGGGGGFGGGGASGSW